MTASDTITLGVRAQPRHRQQMHTAAASLTNSPSSVRVTQPTGQPFKLNATFAIPDARQADVVDRIGRAFWNVEDYSDSAIGFGPDPRPPRRPKTQPTAEPKDRKANPKPKEYKIKCQVPGKTEIDALFRRLPSPIHRGPLAEIYNYRIAPDGFYFIDRLVHTQTASIALRLFIDAALQSSKTIEISVP
jgi:hypothetical protein